ncbi:MAG: nitroreductase [Phycisphaerae bacterium]|nr:nitroreductase [Phycisphaerae bacterium]
MSHEAPVDAPILALLRERWSPYVYSSKPVPDADLRAIFEAARWAPSSYNEQPWRFIVATSADAAAHAKVLLCLVEANQAWAKHAPVLALGCHTTVHAKNGKPNKAAAHDLGQAAAQLSIEAASRGIRVHQMIGIVPERAKELFKVPDGVEVLTGLALGYPGEPAKAAPDLASRDAARRPRISIGETVFAGAWGTPAFGR